MAQSLKSFAAETTPTIATVIYMALNHFGAPGDECGGFLCQCGTCVYEATPVPRGAVGRAFEIASEVSGFRFSVSAVTTDERNALSR